MPLVKSKSKKAFSENVRREMEAGRPQDQALAIAYSVKRKASGDNMEHKKKHESELRRHEKHDKKVEHKIESELKRLKKK